MGTDVAVFQYLLGLYVVVMLCNVALSGALYWKNRSQLYRALLALWVSGAFAFAAQGVLIETPFLVALGFSAVFPTNLALAHLVALATGVPLSWKRFALALFVAVLLSVGIGAAGAGFTLTSLPIAVAVAAPTLFTSLRAIRTRWKGLRISARALVLSAVAFTAHNLDFPFLRDNQPFATFGFTIAFVIVFALSITGPAAALELITEREARLAHELDTARKIQTKILPQDTKLPGLEEKGVSSRIRSSRSTTSRIGCRSPRR